MSQHPGDDFESIRAEIASAERYIEAQLSDADFHKYLLEKQIRSLEVASYANHTAARNNRLQECLLVAAGLIAIVGLTQPFSRSVETAFGISSPWAVIVSGSLLGLVGVAALLSRVFRTRAEAWDQRSQAIELEVMLRHLRDQLSATESKDSTGAEDDHRTEQRPSES